MLSVHDGRATATGKPRTSVRGFPIGGGLVRVRLTGITFSMWIIPFFPSLSVVIPFLPNENKPRTEVPSLRFFKLTFYETVLRIVQDLTVTPVLVGGGMSGGSSTERCIFRVPQYPRFLTLKKKIV